MKLSLDYPRHGLSRQAIVSAPPKPCLAFRTSKAQQTAPIMPCFMRCGPCWRWTALTGNIIQVSLRNFAGCTSRPEFSAKSYLKLFTRSQSIALPVTMTTSSSSPKPRSLNRSKTRKFFFQKSLLIFRESTVKKNSLVPKVKDCGYQYARSFTWGASHS